jgi:hypothetical protein
MEPAFRAAGTFFDNSRENFVNFAKQEPRHCAGAVDEGSEIP